LILEPASKSVYDVPMFTLLKGDCEHCARSYHYELMNAIFGDFSYAYCDTCGALATISLNSSVLLAMPKPTVTNQAIDAAWESFLKPCGCGGHFRRDASPRCLFCHEPLSAKYAASHIERNTTGAPRGWHWQNNWTDTYSFAIEDPLSLGNLRQVTNPFLSRDDETPRKSRWFKLFS
jgi:hypothetical protein